MAELAVVSRVSEDLVANALHELREKDLVVAEPQLMQSTIPGESRREAIARVAGYGAAAVAGSMIVSATAATPAMASSGEISSKCCQCFNKNDEKCQCTLAAEALISDLKCEEYCLMKVPCTSLLGKGKLDLVNVNCTGGKECEL
ncbi:MAG TPA: hypothetical protein VK680_04100 [Solirubrobacteraceae bacterium]|nr:hypothetical protein [Solirubrobacteraceae bacterium]